jgi:hypothetical protein
LHVRAASRSEKAAQPLESSFQLVLSTTPKLSQEPKRSPPKSDELFHLVDVLGYAIVHGS